MENNFTIIEAINRLQQDRDYIAEKNQLLDSEELSQRIADLDKKIGLLKERLIN